METLLKPAFPCAGAALPKMPPFTVRIQQKPIDAGAELALLPADPRVGALVNFIGTVRGHGDRPEVVALQLEHYPEMAEKAMRDILHRAAARWPIFGATVVHRTGHLALGEQMVLVAVAAGHRRDASAACKFVCDRLKTEVPIWKREITADGQAHWVVAKPADDAAARPAPESAARPERVTAGTNDEARRGAAMQITVKYFAGIREAAGCAQQVVALSGPHPVIADLRRKLMADYPRMAPALADATALRYAIDLRTRTQAARLHGGCEVAFFPPVTGG